MKKAIIIIICVLVILGGIFASLFFFTDVFNFLKPANTNFSLQVKKLLGAEKESNYSDYEKFLNNLKSASGSLSSNLDISMNMNLPTTVLDKSTQKTLNSTKINLSTNYDADKKVSSAIAKLKYNNKDSLSAEAILKDQSISIKSSDIYDKYLTFDLPKYEEFCKKNNIDVDKDTLNSIESLKKINQVDNSSLLYDLFYISEKDYKKLDKTYGSLENLIDKKAYTTKKNQQISVNGDEVKTTAYSLTLTGSDGYDFLTKLLDLIKEDSTLKSLIVSKYDILKKYVDSMAEVSNETSGLSSLSESDIEKYLNKLADSLKDSKSDFDDIKKCLKLTIYSNKDNPVKFEIAILDDKKDDEGSIIFTEELSDGKNVYTIDLEKIAKITGGTSSTSSYARSSTDISSIASKYSKLIITDEYEATEDSRKGTAKISVKPSGSSKEDLIIIDYDFINSDSESKSSMSISLSSSLASMASLAGISGLKDAKLDYTSHVTGLNTDTKNVKLSINGNLLSYSIGLDISGTISNKANISEITSSNSVDVFALSQEDFKSTYTDVIKSAADKLPSKLSDFGITVTKEDILKLLPAEEPSTQSTTLEAPTDTTPVVVDQPAA